MGRLLIILVIGFEKESDLSIQTVFYHPFTKSLLVGGWDINFDTLLCGGVCIYNQGNWHSSGANFDNFVNSITGNPSNNNWYACGQFVNVNSIQANYIVMWNGNQFVAMGQGFDNFCNVVAFDSSNGRVYAGGDFYNSGSISVPFLAFWNGSIWAKPVASEDVADRVFSITLIGAGGSFLFGGDFSYFLGGCVARYNHSTKSYESIISEESQSLYGRVNRIAIASNGVVYVAGRCNLNPDFTNSYFLFELNSSAVWSVIAGNPHDDYSKNTLYGLLINSSNGDVYFGGLLPKFSKFGQASSIVCSSGIMRYSPTNYNILPSPSSPSNWTEFARVDNIYSIELDVSRSTVVISGDFQTVNTLTALQSAFYTNNSWYPFPSNFGLPIAAAFNGNYVIGGMYSTAQNLNSTIRKYNISKLGNGSIEYFDTEPHLQGPVYALARNSSSGNVYVGGTMTSPIQYIGMWNGTAWNSLSNYTGKPACGGTIHELAIDPQNRWLYVAGDFQGCGPISTSQYLSRTGGVAKFNPQTGWRALTAYGTLGGSTATFAFAQNGLVYLGGQFLGVNSAQNSKKIIGYDPIYEEFILMQGFENGVVNSIVIEPTTQKLIAAGSFWLLDSQGNINNGLAYFNNETNTWIPFGYFNGQVFQLKILGSSLLVSGDFSRVSGAKLLAKIPPSPYVIKLVGISADPFSILTEFLDGGSLLEYLQSSQPIAKSVLSKLLKDILMGIAHLHANGIVHRDLAARNVLLRKISENSFQCVLTDMGMARLYVQENSYEQTKSTTFPLRWSAPELLKEKRSSVKSDIWSWAVVSIEVFSRRIPFPEYGAMDFAMAMVSGRFNPTAHVNTPDLLKPLINKSFSRNPDKRPIAQELLSIWPI